MRLTSLLHVIEEVMQKNEYVLLFLWNEFLADSQHEGAKVHCVDVVADSSVGRNQPSDDLLYAFRVQEKVDGQQRRLHIEPGQQFSHGADFSQPISANLLCLLIYVATHDLDD